MIARFVKYLMRLGFYVILFFASVWLFLGIPPQETYTRAYRHISRMLSDAGTLSKNTQTQISLVKQEADTQIQNVSDRLNGKDPYEKVANLADQVILSSGARVGSQQGN